MCEQYRATDENALEVDFGALEHSTPHLTLSSSIGKGMNFVSKFLSSKLWAEKEAAKPLVEHMLSMKHRDDVRNHTKYIMLHTEYMYLLKINFMLAEINDQRDTEHTSKATGRTSCC